MGPNAMATMTEIDKQELVFKAGKVFSPATPINTRDLFAGRTHQIGLVGKAVHTRGQHAIIFGERGVGKTSLANILTALLENENSIVVKITCHNDDTYAKVWKNALSEIEIVREEDGIGLRPEKRTSVSTAAESIDEKVGPEDIRRVLGPIGKQASVVVIFDEFDRLHAQKAQRLFADTIKNFSDHALNTTLVIVGVANDVSGLIREHASIDRCLVQIKMPRMEPDELEEIINKAMRELGISITKDALNLLIMLSQGLPHYTHSLGYESTLATIEGGKREITLEGAKNGVKKALDKIQHSILEAYQNAIRGQRKGTLFREALLACALAEVDEQGYFISAAVREPLSEITGKEYDIPGFSQHLDKFSSDESRGPVLEKAGTSRRFRFRFRNPLLQPYVIMRGLADGMLDGELLRLLRAKRDSAAEFML
jgi:Cdc6-like AAA superfamily ATPase